RIADYQRNANRLLVGEAPLFVESVLAVEVSVVARKYHHRVVQHALALQDFQDPPQAVVDAQQHLQTTSNLFIRGRGLRAEWRKFVDLAKQCGFAERRLE